MLLSATKLKQELISISRSAWFWWGRPVASGHNLQAQSALIARSRTYVCVTLSCKLSTRAHPCHITHSADGKHTHRSEIFCNQPQRSQHTHVFKYQTSSASACCLSVCPSVRPRDSANFHFCTSCVAVLWIYYISGVRGAPPFSARCSRAVKLACARPIWSKRPKCEICAYAATQSASGCGEWVQ